MCPSLAKHFHVSMQDTNFVSTTMFHAWLNLATSPHARSSFVSDTMCPSLARALQLLWLPLWLHHLISWTSVAPRGSLIVPPPWYLYHRPVPSTNRQFIQAKLPRSTFCYEIYCTVIGWFTGHVVNMASLTMGLTSCGVPPCRDYCICIHLTISFMGWFGQHTITTMLYMLFFSYSKNNVALVTSWSWMNIHLFHQCFLEFVPNTTRATV